MLDREAVPLNQLQVQRNNSVAPSVQYKPQDMGPTQFHQSASSELIQALGEVAGTVVPVVNTELQKKIQMDKVKQTSNAFRGAVMDEDATQSGQDAYHMVQASQQLQTVNVGIDQWIKDQFRMGNNPTPEQIEAHKNDQYKQVLEMFPDANKDQTVSRFLTVQMQQSQPVLLTSEMSARQAETVKQRGQAFAIQAEQWTAATASENIAPELPKIINAAKAMGVSKDEAMATLFDQATTQARAGDDKLLKVFENTLGYAGNEKIIAARDAYDKRTQVNDSVGIGSYLGDMDSQIEAGTITADEIKKKCIELQKQYGASVVSEGTVRGLLNKLGETSKKRADEGRLLALMDRKNDSLPLAADPTVQDADKAKLPAVYDKLLTSHFNEQTRQGKMTKQQARMGLLQNEVAVSEKEQIKLPQLGNALTGLMNTSAESYKGGNIPAEATQLWNVIRTMSPATRNLYLSGDQQLMFNNFDKFRAMGMNDSQAWGRAAFQRDNPKMEPIDAKTKKKFASAADDLFDTGHWYDFMTGGHKDASVPDWQKNSIKREVQELASTFMQTGTTDPESALKTALSITQANKTRAFNGTVINVSSTQLQKWGAGTMDKFNKQLRTYVSHNSNKLRANAANPALTVNDMEFRVHGGLLRVYDRDGTLINRPTPIGDITGIHNRNDQMLVDQAELRAEAAKMQGEVDTAKSASAGPLKVDWGNTTTKAAITKAQVTVESTNDKKAVSPKGALGLYQIMPKTGANPGLGVRPWDQKKAGDDARFHNEYMTALHKHFDGDIKLTLAGYNAGFGAVDKAIAKAREQGKNPYFENLALPAETRAYVPKILGKVKKGDIRRPLIGG